MKTIQLTLLIFVVIISFFSCSIEEHSLENPLNQTILQATDEMIRRFKDVNFALTFSRINTGMAAITILRKESLPSDTYATSGYPYSYGASY